MRPLAAEPFRGDIRESDPRVREIIASIVRGESAPDQIRLRFSGARGNHLVFYDLDGREVFYRFREDRFDLRAERKLDYLIPGQAYLVRGSFVGVLSSGVLYQQAAAEFPQRMLENNSILAYTYEGASPLRLEQVILP